ncbi:MAG: metallophosphoesterase [Nocardioidaceae bacterium]
MRFAVSDIHGHKDELRAALGSTGLVDQHDDWAGGEATLWFLGDFFDRGPDGIGVVDLVRKLQSQAEQAGGVVRAVLGNHEVLAMGLRKFGTAGLGQSHMADSFATSWLINGGQISDQEQMTDEHVEWLTGLPGVALDGDDLLMHSDTDEYLRWGDSVDDINATLLDVLRGDDMQAWWDCWARLTTRYAFARSDGAEVAGDLMRRLGGRRIVHGHTLIGDLRDIPSPDVDGPLSYAGGRVLGIDGGIYDGGPCLVVPLD